MRMERNSEDKHLEKLNREQPVQVKRRTTPVQTFQKAFINKRSYRWPNIFKHTRIYTSVGEFEDVSVDN